MSWKLKERQRTRLSEEIGTTIKDWGGKASVALIFPNIYSVGMGNLAVHTIYEILNKRDDIVCERVFLPDSEEMKLYEKSGANLMSIESQRPLSEFDVIAFTISFENDYLNILPILSLAKIPHRASKRDDAMPLIIAGGAAPTLNPEPISKMFDAIVLGEFEAFQEDLVPLLASGVLKAEMRNELAEMSGIYTSVAHKQSDVVGGSRVPGPGPLNRRSTKNLDTYPTQTIIYNDKIEFGKMHLMEVQRGCPRNCKFCATPSLYHPPRKQSFDTIKKMIDKGLKHRKRFGLIGADIFSHPDIIEIVDYIHDRGATFSPSSIRVDAVDDVRAKLLAKSGHKSIALGIEAGTEKLRSTLSKGISDAQVFNAAGILAEHGITKLRLYFMIGLPDETADDIEAIAALSKQILKEIQTRAPKKSRSTSVEITISPFIPKPATPFADKVFAGERYIKGCLKTIKDCLRNTYGIKIHSDSATTAVVESLFAMGGTEMLSFLELVHKTGRVKAAISEYKQDNTRS